MYGPRGFGKGHFVVGPTLDLCTSTTASASNVHPPAFKMSATVRNDEKEELMLSCRYGDLDDVKQFIEKFGDVVRNIRDDNGNTVLHMISGNGHEGEQMTILHTRSCI
jgi:ankyrin repeat protein